MLLRSFTRTISASRPPRPNFFLSQASKVSRASMSSLPRLPVFEAIAGHDPGHPAVVHSVSGRRFTYGELLKDAADAKEKLAAAVPGVDLSGQRIAYLVENSYDYVGAEERIGDLYIRRLTIASDSARYSGERCNCITNGS